MTRRRERGAAGQRVHHAYDIGAARNWIAREDAVRSLPVPDIVDLTSCAAARRMLHLVLEQRGLGFFLPRGGRGAARLDARRIAWVVDAALRRCGGAAGPEDVERARRVVRRELIRRLAERMVAAGL